MELRRTANLEHPRMPLDEVAGHEREMLWIPYHSRSSDADLSQKPALLGDVMKGLVTLTEIIMDMQHLFFDKVLDLHLGIDDMWKATKELNRHINAFLDTMMNIEVPVVPHILFLQ